MPFHVSTCQCERGSERGSKIHPLRFVDLDVGGANKGTRGKLL
jgi:hypothetical protein